MSNKYFFYGVFACFVLLLAQAGCWKPNAPGADAPAVVEHADDDHGHGDHGHPEEGPHHGSLIELGKEEYHAELVHDDAAHKVTIYLLDGAAKKSVAIADKEISANLVVAGKPQQFKLPAAPQTEDATGSSSRFELTNKEFCEALDDKQTTGRLNLTIAGKPYAGEITHGGHDHE